MKKFFLTTPIYYVNDMPHIGHAYTTIMADAIKRFRTLQGYQVFFLTGTDEHGQKIEKSAQKQGLTPQELADRVVERYKVLWKTLDIGYDRFIRTTEAGHMQTVQKIFQKVKENGYIYSGQYSGQYCVSCESFTAETGDGEILCPDCGKPTSALSETCYFFRLSAFQERLISFYEKNPDFVTPRSRMNEVVSFVRMGLKDLSISRSTVKWGIPVPGDESQTIYVWFDALTNYLSGIEYLSEGDRFRQFWPADLHVMAKDILKFHAVYWPAFLMAADLEIPKRELIHGWWLKDEKKMSKSSGNVLDPHVLLNHFSSDAIRYFMLREAPIGADGNFSHEGFIQRINSDLTNDWANLVSRTTGMVEKYFGNTFTDPAEYGSGEKEQEEAYIRLEKLVGELFDQYQFNRGLEEIFAYINRLNRYIVDSQPWNLAKEEASRSRLAGILKTLCRAIVSINALLSPVLPKTADKVMRIFRIPKISLGWNHLPESFSIEAGEQLFPRVEIRDFFGEEMKTAAEPPAAKTGEKKPEVQTSSISIEDFRKVQMVVARVLSAEKVPGADKLLQLRVQTGESGDPQDERSLVAGIALHYSPQDLIGKKVIIVKNLQPAKVRGILSQGMIVAASDAGGRPYVPVLPDETPIGAILK